MNNMFSMFSAILFPIGKRSKLKLKQIKHGSIFTLLILRQSYSRLKWSA